MLEQEVQMLGVACSQVQHEDAQTMQVESERKAAEKQEVQLERLVERQVLQLDRQGTQ